jgi:hypothetical protein
VDQAEWSCALRSAEVVLDKARLGWGSGSSDLGWLGRKTERLQDLGHHVGLQDSRDDPHSTRAVWTSKRIYIENTLKEGRPEDPPEAGTVRGRAFGSALGGLVGGPSRWGPGWGRLGWRRHPAANWAGGGEHPVVANAMGARTRDEGFKVHLLR